MKKQFDFHLSYEEKLERKKALDSKIDFKSLVMRVEEFLTEEYPDRILKRRVAMKATNGIDWDAIDLHLTGNKDILLFTLVRNSSIHHFDGHSVNKQRRSLNGSNKAFLFTDKELRFFDNLGFRIDNWHTTRTGQTMDSWFWK